MIGFLNESGEYFEFDAADAPEFYAHLTPCPKRPNPFCAWVGGAWVEDTAARIAADKAAQNAPVMRQIAVIENARQPRAIREAALNMAGAVDRLAALDVEIAALRAKLV